MLQQVRYFLQVAECGSFSAAAKKLFLSPQALMKQTAALEGKLGGRLLERSSGGVRLTPMDRARCKAFPFPGRQLKFYMVLACRPKGQSETLDQIIEAAMEEYGLYEL